MTRITITLKDEEKVALIALSEIEYRDPRLQAAFIIHRELERQRLIQINPIPDRLKMRRRNVCFDQGQDLIKSSPLGSRGVNSAA
jgi:hypothetical protein